MKRALAAVIVLVVLVASACSPDPTGSDEYQALEAELAAVQAERDDLAAMLQEFSPEQRDALVTELEIPEP